MSLPQGSIFTSIFINVTLTFTRVKCVAVYRGNAKKTLPERKTSMWSEWSEATQSDEVLLLLLVTAWLSRASSAVVFAWVFAWVFAVVLEGVRLVRAGCSSNPTS